MEKFAYDYDGIKYVTFEVAKMKSKDSFGRDHTVYVSHREESDDTVKKDKETNSIPAPTTVPDQEEEFVEIPS